MFSNQISATAVAPGNLLFYNHPYISIKVEQNIIVRVANSGDVQYAKTITDEMEASAMARGTGIAKRSPGCALRLL